METEEREREQDVSETKVLVSQPCMERADQRGSVTCDGSMRTPKHMTAASTAKGPPSCCEVTVAS